MAEGGRGAGADAGRLPGAGRPVPPPQGGSRRLLPCMVRGRRCPRGPARRGRDPHSGPTSPTPSWTSLGAEVSSFQAPPPKCRDPAMPNFSGPVGPRLCNSEVLGPGSPKGCTL